MEEQAEILEGIIKTMEKEYVTIDDFTNSIAMVIGEVKDLVESTETNLATNKESLIELLDEKLESKIGEYRDKVVKQGQSSSEDRTTLLDAILTLRNEFKDTLKETLKELKSKIKTDIKKASDTSELRDDIKLDVENQIKKTTETGETIKQKLLSLSDEDKLKLKELGGYEELIALIEKNGVSKRANFLPQSGITTTFFSLNGALIGRAKNINFVEGASLGVILANDTATITIPLGGAGGSTYTPQGVTTATVGGVLVDTDLGVVPILIQDLLDDFLYPYAGPTTTISATPSAGLYEVGDAIASVILSSTTTKRSNNINSFIYRKNGVDIFTEPTPNPTGGAEGFTDATGLTGLVTTTYQARVSDGTSTGTANAVFTFVPVYYFGVGAPGLNIATDGGGLTKEVRNNTASLTKSFSPVTQVYYFAYPSSYPALTSILDTNGFQIISDWTVTTLNVTNSFGVVTNYRQYEFNNLTTQTGFNITFIQ